MDDLSPLHSSCLNEMREGLLEQSFDELRSFVVKTGNLKVGRHCPGIKPAPILGKTCESIEPVEFRFRIPVVGNPPSKRVASRNPEFKIRQGTIEFFLLHNILIESISFLIVPG